MSESIPGFPLLSRFRDACPEAMASIIEGHQANLKSLEDDLCKATEADAGKANVERLNSEIAKLKAIIGHSRAMIRDELPKRFPAIWRSDYRPSELSPEAIGQWLQFMIECFNQWGKSDNSVLREPGTEDQHATDCGDKVEDARSLLSCLADMGHPEYEPRPDGGRKWTPRRAIDEFQHMERYVRGLDAIAPKAQGEVFINDQNRGKSGPGKNINVRMIEQMQKNPDCRGWTARQWAKELNCTHSSVAGTETWKMLIVARSELRATKATDRHRRARASDRNRD